MSRTYSSRLAAMRLEPIHGNYMAAARALLETDERERLKNRRFLVICPFCGNKDQLQAIVRVGAKDREENIRLEERGWKHNVPNRRGRDCEILIVECAACDNPVEPMAYLSPGTFLRDYKIIQDIINS